MHGDLDSVCMPLRVDWEIILPKNLLILLSFHLDSINYLLEIIVYYVHVSLITSSIFSIEEAAIRDGSREV